MRTSLFTAERGGRPAGVPFFLCFPIDFGGEWKREGGEKHPRERSAFTGCLLHRPTRAPGGEEPATEGCAVDCVDPGEPGSTRRPRGRGPEGGLGEHAGGGGAHLVVFAVSVAAAAVRQDAALAVEHVARVALAALHAVVVAVALEADGGAARLAHAHAALVVAVGRAGDGCNQDKAGRRQSGTADPAPHHRSLLLESPRLAITDLMGQRAGGDNWRVLTNVSSAQPPICFRKPPSQQASALEAGAPSSPPGVLTLVT